VRLGDEVAIEQDRRAVAILKPPVSGMRTMSEIISAMESGGAPGIVDEDFAGDVEKGIATHGEPWNPSVLDLRQVRASKSSSE
jgi:hypothetical protein